MPSSLNIVGVQWRSGAGSVCFVAVEYGEYWQAYVGPEKVAPVEFGLLAYQMVHLEAETINAVATHGAKLSWQEAEAFFPDLNILRYKTYPKQDPDDPTIEPCPKCGCRHTEALRNGAEGLCHGCGGGWERKQ